MTPGIVHEGVVEHRHYGERQDCRKPPYKITLLRDFEGRRAWEITAYGRDMRELREGLEVTNRKLEELYDGENSGKDSDELKTPGKKAIQEEIKSEEIGPENPLKIPTEEMEGKYDEK